MPRAKEFADEGARINVRVDDDAVRMLNEMMAAWYPGRKRVHGAVVGRAIRLLYKQFQREQES